MEELTRAYFAECKHFRFTVLPLWHWVLAECTYASNFGHFSGVSLSRDKATAVEKAKSEALERLVYGAWRNTGISPFTLGREECPQTSTGFAAHPDCEVSKRIGFYEFHERASLAAISNSKLRLIETKVPNLGFLFFEALKRIRCDLKAYVSERQPYFCFAMGELFSSQAIFGSASSETSKGAIDKAVIECVRKLAFCKKWKDNVNSSDPFFKAAGFWLSERGLRSARDFCKRALLASPYPSQSYENFDELSVSQMTLDGRFVSYYHNSSALLAAPNGFEIPLL